MILLVLDYCSRFYARQFKDVAKGDADILTRFQQVLDDYYAQKLQRQKGVPSVKYCASELFLSPNYFGDVIRQCLGQSPKDYIRQYVTARAKNLLLSGKNNAQTAEEPWFRIPAALHTVLQAFHRRLAIAVPKTLLGRIILNIDTFPPPINGSPRAGLSS